MTPKSIGEADKLASEMLAFQGEGAEATVPVARVLALFARVKLIACAEAVRCLGASRMTWNKSADDWAYEPDFTTRLKAAELLLDRMDGKPAQTTFNLTADVTGGKLGAGDLLAGPEAASRLRALADQVEKSAASAPAKGASAKRVKAAPVVDGETD